MIRAKKLLALLLSLALFGSLLPVTALAANVTLSPQKLTVDGKAVDCEKYNIDGSNFFQLRELGNLLNFEVGYDADTNTAIVRSEGTAPAEPEGPAEPAPWAGRYALLTRLKEVRAFAALFQVLLGDNSDPIFQ